MFCLSPTDKASKIKNKIKHRWQKKHRNTQKNIGGAKLSTKVPVDEYGSSHAAVCSLTMH